MVERRFSVKISIGADNWSGVVAAINELALAIEDKGPGLNIVAGNPVYGYILVDSENPAQDHDSYFQQVDEWLNNRSGSDDNGGLSSHR